MFFRELLIGPLLACSVLTARAVSVNDTLHTLRLTSVIISAPGDHENRSYYSSTDDFDNERRAQGMTENKLWMADGLMKEHMCDSVVLTHVNDRIARDMGWPKDLVGKDDPEGTRLKADVLEWHYYAQRGGRHRFTLKVKWILVDHMTWASAWDTTTTAEASAAADPAVDPVATWSEALYNGLRPVLGASGLQHALGADDYSPAYASWPVIAMAGPALRPTKVTSSKDCVVTVTCDRRFCSGVLVSTNGQLVTSAALFDSDTGSVEVHFNDGSKVKGRCVRLNARADLALVQLERTNTLALAADHGDSLLIGDPLFSISTPVSMDLGQSVSTGILSSLREREGIHYLQTDVKLGPGSVGGALLGPTGRLVGILAAKREGRNAQGIGFALPVKMIEQFLRVELLD